MRRNSTRSHALSRFHSRSNERHHHKKPSPHSVVTYESFSISIPSHTPVFSRQCLPHSSHPTKFHLFSRTRLIILSVVSRKTRCTGESPRNKKCSDLKGINKSRISSRSGHTLFSIPGPHRLSRFSTERP